MVDHLPATTPIPGATAAHLNAATNVSAAASAISVMKKGGTHELVLYQQVGMGTGAQSNNPWLLELPDPITRATWDNFAKLYPNFIKEPHFGCVRLRRTHPKFELLLIFCRAILSPLLLEQAFFSPDGL